MEFAGKTALVTGASRGLGRAAAKDLAASGALVAINYASNDAAAHETLAGIEAAGGQAFLIREELGTLDAAERLRTKLDAELVRRTGRSGLDFLINNAGGGPAHNVDTTTPQLFERMIAQNLGATFYVTKVLKSCLRDNGRVVMVSSRGARTAVPEYVVYCMAKAGVETLTRVLAQELGPRGITVNCIAPGMIATEANADMAAVLESSGFFKNNTIFGRQGQAADFAGVVHALVSSHMGFVTGEHIEVSGGQVLRMAPEIRQDSGPDLEA